MVMKRLNYKNIILKESVIPKLRKDIERLNNNVSYRYPQEEAEFPLVVVSISDSPYAWNTSKEELISAITVSISVLDEHESDCLDLEFDVSTCMLELGYTRQEPTMPYWNSNYGKWQIDIRYRIAYNILSESFQRLI